MAGVYEDDEVTCVICHEEYDLIKNIPKLLNCLHTFCLTCLEKFENGRITCPYRCGTLTKLEGRSPHDLKTNTYILPRIEALMNSRETGDDVYNKALSNRAEALAIRREVLALKLAQISKAVKFAEKQLMLKTEDNNKHMDILENLVEGGGFLSDQADIQLPPIVSQSYTDLRKSEVELEAVKAMSEEFTSLENFTCRITLTDSSTGKNYNVKGPLSFNAISAHGSQVGASVSLLTYALQQLRVSNLWEEVKETHHSTPIKSEPVFSQLTSGLREMSLGHRIKSEPSPSPSRPSSANSSGYVSPTVSPSPIPMLTNLNGKVCFLQFSVNGNIKPNVFIKLYCSVAPIMCSAFLKYIMGVGNLSYCQTPLRDSEPNKFISFGEFAHLKQDNVDRIVTEQDRTFVPDRSWLADGPGAVSMQLRVDQNNVRKCSSEFTISLSKDYINRSPITTVFGYVYRGLDVCEDLSCIRPSSSSKILIHLCAANPELESLALANIY